MLSIWTTDDGDNLKLTLPERLIISMLADVHDKLGITSFDTKLLRESIHSDNTWALSWELPGIVGDNGEKTPPDVKQVVDHLDMWSFIEQGIATLDKEEQAEVNAAAGNRTKFIGYDGNNESRQFNIATHLVKVMGRWSEFAKRDFNSHSAQVARNDRMLSVFEPIRRTLDMTSLSKLQLIEILTA